MINTFLIGNLMLVIFISSLVGCGNSEDSKVEYMQQGQALFQEKRYEKAVLAYKNVLQIDPKHIEAHYQLAEALGKLGKLKSAYGHYKWVINQDEKHFMSRVRVGQIMILSQQFEKADKYGQETLVLAPDNVDVLIFHAALRLVKKDNNSALGFLDKALSVDSDSSSAIVMKASIFAKTELLDKAIEILKKGIERQPENESMHLMLANLYLSNKSKTLAEAELVKLTELKPDSIKYYKRLAYFYDKEDKISAVESVLRKAVTSIPNNEDVALFLVDFLAKKKSLGIAITELNKLIEQSPLVNSFRFKLFSLHIQKGELAVAESILIKVIDDNKHEQAGLKARNALAKLYGKTQRVDQAKVLIVEVLSENPRDAISLLLRAQFAYADKRYPESITDLRSVLVDQPENIQALILISAAYIANNDRVLGQESIEKVVALAPDNIKARLGLIEILLQAGSVQLAETHIAEVLKLQPDDKRALGNLFKINVNQKNWNNAQQIALKIGKTEKGKAMGFYLSGLAYQAEKSFEKSIDVFKQSIKASPKTVEPLLQIVKSYIALNQRDNAIAFLERLTTLYPDYSIAFDLLGEFYADKKKMLKAEQAFKQSILLKADRFNSYRSLAKLYKLKNDLISAISILREGIQAVGISEQSVNDLVVIYHQQGKFEDIIQLYQKAYKKFPQSETIINNLAGYLSDYSNNKESLAQAAKIAEPLINSKKSTMLDTLAWIAYKQENFDKAQEVLEKAISLGAVSPIISYHLGMVYYQQGSKQLAKRYLEKAVAENSDFHGVDIAKATLKIL